MKKSLSEKLLIFLPILVLFVFSLYFDKEIVMIFSKIRASWLTVFLLWFSKLSSVIFVSIFILVYLWFTKKKNNIWKAYLSMFFTAAACLLLKITLKRPRPFLAGTIPITIVIEKSFYTWNASFPSFQAATVFVILPFLEGKIKNVWLIIAIILALARVYFGIHYLSDIIAGSLLGYYIGSRIKKIK